MVYKEYEQTFRRKMREVQAPNHLLYLFEAGIDRALINADTHCGEDWNGSYDGSLTEVKMADLLNDDETPQHYKWRSNNKR